MPNNNNNFEFTTYKSPKYIIKYFDRNNYVQITFNKKFDRYFTLNTKQFMDVYFNHYKFHQEDDDEYPFYMRNGKKNSIIEFLLGYKFDDLSIKYKNGNKYDLRKRNIIVENHKYYEKIKNMYEIKGYINGHVNNIGGDAYVIKNPIWETKNGEYIMYCGGNEHTIMCKKTYDILRNYEKDNNEKLTFTVNLDNYVTSSKKIYLHQIIKKYCQKNNIKCKYYIDKDRLNNRFNNFVSEEDNNDNVEMIVKRKVREVTSLNRNYFNEEPINYTNTNYNRSVEEESTHMVTIADNIEIPYNIYENFKSYIANKNLEIHSVEIRKYIAGKDNPKNIYNPSNCNSKLVVFDYNTTEEYILMHIRNDIFTKICREGMKKIKDINSSFYMTKNGYVRCSIDGKHLYLHQILTGYYGNKNDGNNLSVDHGKHDDKLDNTMKNLIIRDQSFQNSNRGKQKRNFNTQKLPEGLTQDMMPIYVYYCTEKIQSNTLGKYTREFFRIEKHPKLDKVWSSSKSIKKTWQEKLEQTKKKLYELDNNIKDETYKLPQYVSKNVKKNGKVQLIYDRRVGTERRNMRMTINNYTESQLPQKVEEFLEKVRKKYGENK